MDNERESFIFYKSFYEALKEADEKTQNEVFIAICKKGLYDEDTKLSGISKMLYTLIKPQLEANTKRYNDGKKGGRPKKEKTTGYEKIKTTGYENKKPNNNVNDNVNVNVNDNVNANVESKIIKCYEENIGLITPATVDLLFDYLKDMDYELIIEAIKIATLANKRSGRYINGILKDWSNKGYKTLLDLENEKQEKENKKPKEETEEEKTARKLKALEEGLKNAKW